eukprot:TRINITY_DN17703_c0_g1_i1.p1 TRINITY_DN17703_c0_g1~~TRINITY_DN17703_c0_g1_i1.p1  ORF type:complete len:378 (-),score=68.84 TRINITY_DN17703_c0_g1_i1:53-1186(-)
MSPKLDAFSRIHLSLMGDLSCRDKIREVAREAELTQREVRSAKVRRSNSDPSFASVPRRGTSATVRRRYVTLPEPVSKSRPSSGVQNWTRGVSKGSSTAGQGACNSRLGSKTVALPAALEPVERKEAWGEGNLSSPSRSPRSTSKGSTSPSTASGSQSPAAVLDRHALKLIWVARKNRVTLDVCRQAAELFCKQVPTISDVIDRKQFAHSLCAATGAKSTKDLPPDLLQHSFDIADKDKNGEIDFHEFISWYSSVGFNINLTLSEEERKFREFCREHDFNMLDCDKYLQFFKEFDEDNSGSIDQEEFEQLIRKCARVPKGLEIPAARLKQLWAEADDAGRGALGFQEFALFYQRYFEGDAGFEDFYRNIRPHGKQLR